MGPRSRRPQNTPADPEKGRQLRSSTSLAEEVVRCWGAESASSRGPSFQPLALGLLRYLQLTKLLMRQMMVNRRLDQTTHLVGRDGVQFAGKIVVPIPIGSRLSLGRARRQIPGDDLPSSDGDLGKHDLDVDLRC